MKNIFIKKYIDKLTINDIKNYCKQNNIVINDNELNIIYNYIKKNYITILENPNKTLDDASKLLSHNTYLNIKNLYLIYRDKYKHYL